MKIILTNAKGGVSVVHPVPKIVVRQVTKEVPVEKRVPLRNAFRRNGGRLHFETVTVMQKVLVKERQRETPAEAAQRFLVKLPPDTNAHIVDPAALPQSREFRNAWVKIGDAVAVSLPRARAIQLERIRKARDRTLQETDGMMLADQEQGKDVKALKARRQEWRDIPQTIQASLDAAKSAEDISKVWPSNLKR